MEFTTTRGHQVEIRDFLPQKYAMRQQLILSEGMSLKDMQNSEVDATSALKALEVIVEGMVIKLDDSGENLAGRLGDLASDDYAEISAKCTEAMNQDKKKTSTT